MNKTLILLLTPFLLLACQESSEVDSDEIVVMGGGLMGSATAWQLSKQGYQVRLIEKQDSIYTQGSSFGEARIARSNNRGNDIWSYLHNRSVREVQDLVDFLDENEPEAKHVMEDIYTTSPVTYVGRTRIHDRLLASLERQAVKYDMATSPLEGKEMYNVELPDSVLMQREYNLHSGMINPQALIQKLHQAIRNKGGRVEYGTKIRGIEYNAETDLYDLAVVKDQQEQQIRTRKLVSALGPYTGSILKPLAPYLDTLINPQRVFLAFFRVDPKVYQTLSPEQQKKLQEFYPVINSSKGTRAGSFFSMIEYFDPEGNPIIKIGGHFQRSDIDELDQVWQKELKQEELDWSLNSTAGYMQMLSLPIKREDIQFVDGYSCVYSLTASEVPIVSPIIADNRSPNPNVVILGGMSGVGAKGAMTYGLIAADLFTQREERDSMYWVVKEALGFARLLEDVY
ncbi:MAG: FAD-dependent oxidoreductase [Saprospiraceae bacterium]|nr:FAD-dependent oxidoreductase [Saprospiraceae bacterium]